MLYIATVHWQSDKWVDIQLRYLQKNIKQPFKVFAFLSGDACKHYHRYDFACCEPITEHAIKLNLLAKFISLQASDDDVIIFIDGDAFPIKPIDEFIIESLSKYPLAAVKRVENIGDIQPHPSFCITTVGFWKSIKGDWKEGYQWSTTAGYSRTDVGGNLLKALNDKNVEWLPLLRTSQLSDHGLMFGIYADLIYHHGSGFRNPLSMYDRTKSLVGVVKFKPLALLLDRILPHLSVKNRFRVHRLLRISNKLWEINQKESERIYKKLFDGI
ncbi:MAG: hypothetical protein PWR03_1563 [Tenuifilum sp.]|jgi:hypothetical protein|uniref:hypothetical protein n=1 Tax=Tenuifilum sp. TaxID=2760880 RepID=UPI0024AAC387|nr:hypothetical protein [Tenuifilum sp.]MDI3527380.1 hypothetical protein [Tenuifilum sp.]